MSHTPEPWCVGGVTHQHRIARHDESGARDCYDTPIIWAKEGCLQGKMEDKARAVDCVNACAGLPKPKEDIKKLAEKARLVTGARDLLLRYAELVTELGFGYERPEHYNAKLIRKYATLLEELFETIAPFLKPQEEKK